MERDRQRSRSNDPDCFPGATAGRRTTLPRQNVERNACEEIPARRRRPGRLRRSRRRDFRFGRARHADCRQRPVGHRLRPDGSDAPPSPPPDDAASSSPRPHDAPPSPSRAHDAAHAPPPSYVTSSGPLRAPYVFRMSSGGRAGPKARSQSTRTGSKTSSVERDPKNSVIHVARARLCAWATMRF